MKFILFLFIFFVLTVTSCEKQCIKALTAFSLIGFSDAEADTIILRKFSKEGSFSQPLDTVLLEHIIFHRSDDTLSIVASPGFVTLLSNYNYEIFFPESATTFSITDIIEDQKTMTKGLFNCTKEACINSITGCTVNGQFTNSVDNQNLIYLKK